MRNFPALLCVFTFMFSCNACAEKVFFGELDATQEVPTNASVGTGFGQVTLNDLENLITVSVNYSGLSSGVTIGHIHGPAIPGSNAPVLFDLSPSLGQVSGSVLNRSFAIDAVQLADLKAGRLYFNFHTIINSGGEIRGQIVPRGAQVAVLNAAQATTPNTSTALGFGIVEFSLSSNVASVNLSWIGLASPATLLRIHIGAPGTPGAVVCNLAPIMETAGVIYNATCDFTEQQSALVKAGDAYFNIYTDANPNGEIRGPIKPPSLLRDGFEGIAQSACAARPPGYSSPIFSPRTLVNRPFFNMFNAVFPGPAGARWSGAPNGVADGAVLAFEFNAPLSSTSGRLIAVNSPDRGGFGNVVTAISDCPGEITQLTPGSTTQTNRCFGGENKTVNGWSTLPTPAVTDCPLVPGQKYYYNISIVDPGCLTPSGAQGANCGIRVETR